MLFSVWLRNFPPYCQIVAKSKGKEHATRVSLPVLLLSKSEIINFETPWSTMVFIEFCRMANCAFCSSQPFAAAFLLKSQLPEMLEFAYLSLLFTYLPPIFLPYKILVQVAL